MRRLLTKESRLQSRYFQFNSLLARGFKRETYKDIDLFISDEIGFYLKVFIGTSSNHTLYTNYRSPESRAKVIAEQKTSADYREQRKATEKANPTISTAANTSKAIRQDLKTNFPNTTFKVTSSNYSGGNSVHISWEDGPTTAEVEAFTGKYQQGHFNGMDDIYEYSNVQDGLPQVKYVQEQRSISDASKEILLPFAQQLFEKEDYGCHNAENLLYRLFSKSSFKSTPIGIDRSGLTCGTFAEFYEIKFEDKSEPVAPVKITAPEMEPGKVSVIEYSEKSVAIIGDTKPIKDKLKALGGSFNARLSCGAGWVFPKTKLEAIKNELSKKTENV